MGDEKNTEQKPKEIENIETKEFSQEKNNEDGKSKSQQDIQSVDDQIESQKNQQQEQQKQKQKNQQKHQRKRKGGGGSGSSGKSKIQQPIKRKRKREEGAPKLPLTGYVRYILFRRDTIRKEYPNKTNVEHTKMIADEWNRMSEELKKPYLQAAEVDKERYNKQLIEFNKQKKAGTKGATTENLQQQPNSKSSSNNSTGVNNSSSGTSSSGTHSAGPVAGAGAAILQNGRDIPNHTIKPLRRYGDNFSIQIFTDEFLEHNKTTDIELRTLRKSNIDYEQQNSVLEKHIENMKFGVEKMQTENSELIEKNFLLETYLQKLKVKLAQALSGLAIPTEPNGATIDNIDKYMADLHSMASSNSHGPASLNKAKDIIRKLDLQIQL